MGGLQSTVINMSVYLSVRSHNSKTTWLNSTNFSVAQVRSSSNSVAMCYVLVVLWMTSCFHIMALWRVMCTGSFHVSSTNTNAFSSTISEFDDICTNVGQTSDETMQNFRHDMTSNLWDKIMDLDQTLYYPFLMLGEYRTNFFQL